MASVLPLGSHLPPFDPSLKHLQRVQRLVIGQHVAASKHLCESELLVRPVLARGLADRVVEYDVGGGEVTLLSVPFEFAGPSLVADPVADELSGEGDLSTICHRQSRSRESLTR